jgi:hypothetical protein
MKDLKTVPYHPMSEMLVDVLCKKTQRLNTQFFRVQVAYFLGKMASMMRCSVQSTTRNTIPVNVYAINLAPSGSGKGHSTNIIEREIINGFRDAFLSTVFEEIKDINLATIALDRHSKTGKDQDAILKTLQGEYVNAGNMAFSFDSATPAAIKQLRHKLLLAGAGSLCLEIDEIGSNLIGNTDVLNTFMELYDIGTIKQKLTKNTNDNTRSEEIVGSTPANTLWFGTPAKLMDGAKVEETLMEFFETGFARRCMVSYTRKNERMRDMSSQDIIDMLNDPQLAASISLLHNHFTSLATTNNFNKVIIVPNDVETLLVEYHQMCESIADDMKEHEEIRKAEIAHRYFKVLKLAGIYAFIDGSNVVSEDNLYAAIRLVEDCGESFKALLSRDRAYVKLAKYIADVGTQVTHADMVEELPFFKGSQAAKQEMMTLAIAWGYKNNIIIKKSFESGIEFLSGESIKETDISKMLIAYSRDLVDKYSRAEVKFFGMKKFLMNNHLHFVNHDLKDGYRDEDHIIPGFNMLILDVDGTTTIQTAQLLLKDLMHVIYTTKSHTPTDHRFRILLPMSHVLKLDSKEYKEFMDNVFEWLPFQVDTQTSQRSRKWRTWKGDYYENKHGELFNVLPFIPKTAQNEERKKAILDTQSLTNLERWFIQKTGNGNRNGQLLKYALLCVDQGYDYHSTLKAVQQLNEKLQDPISDQEILTTVMVTAGKRISENQDKVNDEQ